MKKLVNSYVFYSLKLAVSLQADKITKYQYYYKPMLTKYGLKLNLSPLYIAHYY
jgi:hypothetical protein